MSSTTSHDVSQEIAQLQRLQSQTRTWRLITVLAVIAILVTGLGSVLHQANLLSQSGPEQKEFVDELGSGLQSDILPQVQQLAGQTLSGMVPLLKNELQKVADRAPEIANAAKHELALLSKNLQEKGQKTLDATFGESLKKRETKIKEMYPDVDEHKIATLVDNITKVGTERMEETVHTLFAGHILALDKIVKSMEAIHKSEGPNVSEETPTWEMALLVFDILRDDVRELETAAKPGVAPLKTSK